MAQDNSGTSSGIGFFGLLCILFIGLKLTGYIEWSWLWVLAPIWGPVAIGLFLMAVGALGLLWSRHADRERRRIRERRSGRSA
ncbi:MULTISPECIES: hypothetical protein [Methylobacterium]|jgi:hypothetical protein|uniref:Transmembrane protein n=2 Tax=Methylobacterium TaxID=407 RepID=A0A2U8VU03_9HYPH|nr:MULTISPECIES: hypothetical protein [Methylobacterium]AWN36596.1 hypothetical protein DK427_13350 [Methylobacterium radiodurans]GJD55061.1 hypothetical protein IFDJLNFL_0943 [Methylobacterium dankookense]VUF12059.1 hypothetical protein MTDSW087_01747 [Methylobacterium dankookense]